jgi:diadenosine tetraphosphatase ApaH/serine/threonine PP2A family protein phosphatase
VECLERLGDEDGIWVWQRFNRLFNYLPLAAVIESKILCMHGGIGRCISRVEQVRAPVCCRRTQAQHTA